MGSEAEIIGIPANLSDFTWLDYSRGFHYYYEYSREVDGKKIFLLDEMIDSYFISKPYFVFPIIIMYLAFVLKFGIKFMENREPMNIKKIMIVYNLFQVIYCSLWVYFFFSTGNVIAYLLNHSCHPLPAEYNGRQILYIHGLHSFLFMKLADLLDTVFIVLTKKNSHITVLHLYHHTSMVLNTWACIKLIKDDSGAIMGVLNCAVHVVMYSYYLISAAGPPYQQMIQPYKSWITKLQIGQFVVLLAHICILLTNNCDISPSFAALWIVNLSAFTILFINFYIRNYCYKTEGTKPKVKSKHM